MDDRVLPSTSRRMKDGASSADPPEAVLLDYDFHPDEETVRVFPIPMSAVLRLDDEVLVTETRAYGHVLRHYAFAKHWFKINVGIDDQGCFVATGDGPVKFAFNCDVATPMERDGQCVFGVDLFIDVLIEADASSFHVQDEVEFQAMADRGLLSNREAARALGGLDDLLELIRTERLVEWLSGFAAFGPCDPPNSLPMERLPVPTRMQRLTRVTW